LIDINGIPWNGEGKLAHYRIEDDHSNSYVMWPKQGSPESPSPKHAAMKAAGDLATMDNPSKINVTGGDASVSFMLPIRALSLIIIEKYC
jgi:xylan 1,4-beta-xylosidase